MVEQLMNATGVKDALNLLILLVLALLGIVVLVAAAYVWAKFHRLPKVLKTALLVALGLAVAYAAGLWTPEGIAGAWRKTWADAVDTYYWYDGYTRTHRYIGIIALALLVPLAAIAQGSREAPSDS